jgi:hypothetical protein
MSQTQLILGSYEVRPTQKSPEDVRDMSSGVVYVGTEAGDTTAADIAMQTALREDGYEIADIEWVEAAAALELDTDEARNEIAIIKEALEDPDSGGVGYGIFYWFAEDAE